jgi:tRNA C32,U32 (ribose-2'-O)-methylase TrmJ
MQAPTDEKARKNRRCCMDQSEELHVIAARARHRIREALIFQVLDDHLHRAQEPLCIAVQADDLVLTHPAPERPRQVDQWIEKPLCES